LEQAQAKAPAETREQMDAAIIRAEELRRFATKTAHSAAARGGIRVTG